MVRLVSFLLKKTSSPLKVGALIPNKGVLDLSSSFPDMRTLLQAGQEALNQIQNKLKDLTGSTILSTDQVTLKAPIYNPEKIICIGLNYKDHAQESGMKLPSEPVFFAKYPTSIIGDGDEIILPKESNEVDYEVEMVIVIGKTGKRISEKDALEHVVGYTVGHDVSARDFQLKKDGNQWIKGKTFDTFAPIGPAIVTKDEISDIHNLKLKTILNGEVLQDSSTNQLYYGVPQLVSYLSSLFTLNPGDLIFTGTPPGVGFAKKPPIFLKDGDSVVVEVEELGKITNPVRKE